MDLLREETNQIKQAAEAIVTEEGAELIEFRVFFSRGRYVVRCIIDYPQGGVTVKTCAEVNNRIRSFMEEASFLGGNFEVEVNSPGLDRKLKTPKDFLRVQGRLLSLWVHEPIEGKSYVEGVVMGINEDCLVIKAKEKVIEIPLSQIKVGKEKVG